MIASSSKFLPEMPKQWSSQLVPMITSTGNGAIEYRGCFALPQPRHWKRKHYAAPLHVAIMLIYFTLHPEAYFRGRFPTPSGMDIHGIDTEKEFSDDYLRSVAMCI
jgi:hypothetical protein